MIVVQDRDKESYVILFFFVSVQRSTFGLDIKQEMQGYSSAQVVILDEEEVCVPRFSNILGLMVTLSSLSAPPPKLTNGMCRHLLRLSQPMQNITTYEQLVAH